jgi:GntR family transcriptional repressor for pyruvate dehydrogenase complex
MHASAHEDLFTALAAVAESKTPLGAWNLRKIFDERDIHISEATCGRLLRTLEDAEYVKSVGRRGRVITNRGLKTLEEWKEKQNRYRSDLAFSQSLRIRGADELKDVLVARKAIEGETAALAAAHATDEDIQKLQSLIQDHKKTVATGAPATDENSAFHRAVSQASKNKVLSAAVDIIYRHPDVPKALEYIRNQVGSILVEDHLPILDRIIARDPEGAKREMLAHIENVIKDVDTYWREWMSPPGEQE